jgi:hypothetical protein
MQLLLVTITYTGDGNKGSLNCVCGGGGVRVVSEIQVCLSVCDGYGNAKPHTISPSRSKTQNFKILLYV